MFSNAVITNILRIIREESCGFAFTKYSAYKMKKLAFENGEGDFSVIELPWYFVSEVYPNHAPENVARFLLFEKNDKHLLVLKNYIKIWRSKNA